jgi:uncharacterized protein (DUF1778 family)
MARPRKHKPERRDAQVNIRLTDAERVALEEKADNAGLTLAEYMRQRAIAGRVTPKRPAADDRLLHELNMIGVNINQIARALNAEHTPGGSLEEALAHLHRVLDQIATAHDS